MKDGKMVIKVLDGLAIVTEVTNITIKDLYGILGELLIVTAKNTEAPVKDVLDLLTESYEAIDSSFEYWLNKEE